MQSRLLAQDASGQRTYVLIFETGEEVVGELNEFVRANHITGARFTAIGAFSDATVRFFNWERKEYVPIPIREQVEVLVLTGDVAMKESGEPKVHIHVVLGKSDGTAHGGDLGEAHVRPTLELILVEMPAHLRRVHDERSGLSLIRP